MGFHESAYKPVFTAVETMLGTVTSIKKVVLGEQFRVAKLPMAIINPGRVVLEHHLVARTWRVTVGVQIVVIIRETEPDDVFEDITAKLNSILDTLLADETLAGSCKGLSVTEMDAGEIRFRNKLYYGGVVRFDAFLFYSV